MHDKILTDKNFFLYCAQNYSNPCCESTEEFEQDIRRIKYIKKLITRYTETGELKERLILNHLIVLSNVFAPEPLCRILLLKMESQFTYLKPFLLQLGFLIRNIMNVRILRKVDTDLIPMNQGVIIALRNILNANKTN